MLFAGHRRKGGINNISLWAGGKRKLLLELEGQRIANPVYAASGHILFERGPTTQGIWALPFSLARLEVLGEPFLVAPGGTGPTISAEGTLAFVAGASGAATQMTWVDREGKELGTIGQPESDASMNIWLSPDGKRVARGVTANDNRDLWIYDTARGTRTRLTFDPATDDDPSWSPSGNRVVHTARLKGTSGAEGFMVLLRAADGTGSADTLAGNAAAPTSTPDGRHVLYVALERNGAIWNLMETPLEGSRIPRLLLNGNPWVQEGRVAPIGNFMAYMSHESGEWEIFLTRYPSCEGKWQVSVAGGQWPRWNAKGDRLFFAQADDIMEVEVGGTTAPALGTPRRLFARPPLGAGAFGWYPGFDVSGDGSRFFILRGAGQKGLTQGVAVVQNWLAEFEGKAAASKAR
jgi:dipeptidyl aminopeptidase/acylaminoacyl peptidase